MSANPTVAGDGLRELRHQAGVSQQELAGMADCSIAMVRLIEAGYRPEGSQVLPRLLEALNDTTPPADGAVSKTRPRTAAGHGPA